MTSASVCLMCCFFIINIRMSHLVLGILILASAHLFQFTVSFFILSLPWYVQHILRRQFADYFVYTGIGALTVLSDFK